MHDLHESILKLGFLIIKVQMNRPITFLTCDALKKQTKKTKKLAMGMLCVHTVRKQLQYRPSQSVDSVVRRLLAKPWMRERAAAAHSLSLSLSLSRPLTINIILTLRNFFL